MLRSLSAAQPLVAYAETCCDKARVLLVGRSDSPLVSLIVERGARLLHVVDSNATRRATAQAASSTPDVTFGSLNDGTASLRESFFDLVLVENLATLSEPKAALTQLAKLLTPRGVALIATPNPDTDDPLVTSESSVTPLDYYALYDAAIAVWPEVRMLGQVPFVGYAVVDFAGEGEPSPVLDTSLVSATGEEPDYFVALAGRERRTLDAYAVIQLPLAAVRASAERPTAPPPPPPIAAVHSAPALPATNDADRARIAELEKQLARQEKWIAELEARSSTADERADAAESELEELREQRSNAELTITAERAAHQALQREQDEAHQRERASFEQERQQTAGERERLAQRVAALEALLASKDAALAARDLELAGKAQELEALQSDEQTAREQERLEAQLRERGERIAQLERDLFEGERVGRELLRRVNELGAARPAQGLVERLAEAEAELVTLRWSLDLSRGSSRATSEPA